MLNRQKVIWQLLQFYDQYISEAAEFDNPIAGELVVMLRRWKQSHMYRLAGLSDAELMAEVLGKREPTDGR